MRAALLASVVFLVLITLGVRSRYAHDRGGPVFVRFGKAGRVIEVQNPVFTVEGRWDQNADEAERAALEEARYRLLTHLQNQNPPIEYAPPAEFVNKLVRKKENQSKNFEEPVGEMHRVRLELELTRSARAELVRLDREHRSKERMAWLGKVLGLLVVLLTAVAGYVHLDEHTKGYYTTWLRLGVAGVAALVGAGLWWIV